jgi:peptide/nickel transport system substrate-binding protein
MESARAVQITAPQTANNLWARIDRALVDRAAWLPLVTPTNTDLVSKRVGNYRYQPLWGPLLDQLWVR